MNYRAATYCKFIYRLEIAFLFGIFLTSCGQGTHDAEFAAAPIRDLKMDEHKLNSDTLICVGMRTKSGVEDFPSALLDDVFKKYRTMRPWSSCKREIAQSKHWRYETTFVCGIASQSPNKVARVSVDCSIHPGSSNGSTLWFDVTRNSLGKFVVKRTDIAVE
ncbi:MAG TPA: hypothetical protein VHW02_02165 [Rhizomicrobium sp.]|nr:hypothetical protein [Rhizomicrobium sp.]